MNYKNQPNNTQSDCNLVDGQNLVEFVVIEENLLEENEDMLRKQDILKNEYEV